MSSWLFRSRSARPNPIRKSVRARPSQRRLLFERLEGRAMLTPIVSVSADWVFEGETISAHVTLDNSSEETVAVDFAIGDLIADRVATPVTDYFLQGAPTGVFSGTITFAPDELECIFFIGTIDDIGFEQLEWLRIQLSNPVNAQFGQY